MKVSCLSVTNRPAFREWLEWNIYKQSHKDLEVIIIDHPGQVPDLRTEAVQRATGEALCWFDDDDYSHPNRVEACARFYSDVVQVVGSRNAWFVDLETEHHTIAHASGGPFFNGAMYGTELAKQFEFVWARGEDGEFMKEAEDVIWKGKMEASSVGITTIRWPLHFWLCHDYNSVNKTGRWKDQMVEQSIVPTFRSSDPELGDQLAKLRARVAEHRATIIDNSLKRGDRKDIAMAGVRSLAQEYIKEPG